MLSINSRERWGQLIQPKGHSQARLHTSGTSSSSSGNVRFIGRHSGEAFLRQLRELPVQTLQVARQYIGLRFLSRLGACSVRLRESRIDS